MLYNENGENIKTTFRELDVTEYYMLTITHRSVKIGNDYHNVSRVILIKKDFNTTHMTRSCVFKTKDGLFYNLGCYHYEDYFDNWEDFRRHVEYELKILRDLENEKV